jgi:hypothetical protein
MFFSPNWITGLPFEPSCVFSGDQPIATPQFGITLFSLVMMVTFVLLTRSHRDFWLSLAFFPTAAIPMSLTFRQFRMLPPQNSFE